ncbi:MAG: hypothetical protein AAB340_00020 [Patescibacteria group bacterium]
MKKQDSKKSTDRKFSGEKVGILGNGEVGSAIAKFYENPKIKDLSRNDGLQGVDILHVCIPFTNKFVDVVEKEIKNTNPKLTIVHSTVSPGTIKSLAEKFPDMVVHSPVRGVHPNLHEGIKTFIKYVGADSKKAGLLAKKHFEKLGIKVKVLGSSTATEVGKILDTTYYGVVIAWHGEMKEICDQFGVNFDEAVTDFNNTYNEGYTKLGKKNVVRPVLYPPQNGKAKHCIVPNVAMLSQHYKTPFFELLLKKYRDKL